MEWLVKLFFKLALLVMAVWIGFSFVRQLFSPIQRPTVLASPGGSRLPGPLPKGGLPASDGKPKPPPIEVAPPSVNVPRSGGPAASTVPASDPIDASAPITEAIHDQIVYRFLNARTQGNRLTIRLQVLNKGLDRMLEISSLPWSKTLFYNERSEVYRPQDVLIANTRANAGKTRAMLVSGNPAEILLVYGELPMTAGTLTFRQVTLIQLDAALFSTEQAYRNSFADPLAVSRPTLRFLPITEGAVASSTGMQR